jgi:hypothetical protein
MGGLQAGRLHAPLAHVSVPPVMLHFLPQPPQLPTSVLRFVSQPFAGLPSQSMNPGAHCTIAHFEATHFSRTWTVLHAAPQAPQLAASFVVFTQALLPLQNVGSSGLLHDSMQEGGVPLQTAVPLAGAEHAAHVVPHDPVDVELSGTQVPLQL